MSSAGQIVGGIVGAVVGFYAGGPSGAYYGLVIGAGLGGLIDPPKGPNLQGPRLNDLRTQTSTYGAVIGRDYGTIAHTGNLFWLENNQLKETKTTKSVSGKGGSSSKSTTYTYSATFAVGFAKCKRPFLGVRRIWIGPKLIFDAASPAPAAVAASNRFFGRSNFLNQVIPPPAPPFAIYLGSDDQLPDPRMQATLGINNTPAFRGLAYIVFYDLQLAEYQNSLLAAQIKVEWVSEGTYPFSNNNDFNGYDMPNPGSAVWTGLANKNGLLCSISSTGSAASVDAQNWIAGTVPAQGWNALADNGTVFCAVGNGATDTNVSINSNNGSSWNVSVMPEAHKWKAITAKGKRFVAIANNSDAVAFSDLFADAWVMTNNAASALWNAVAANDTAIVAVMDGANCGVSEDDGVTWTLYAMPSNQDWAAITQKDNVFCAVSRSTRKSATSSDNGHTWTEFNIGGPAANYFCVSANSDYFFLLALGSDGYMISVDGEIWFSGNSGTRANWRAITTLGEMFVGVGAANGEIGNFGGAVTLLFQTNHLIDPAPVLLSDIVEAECINSNLLTSADIDVTGLTDQVRGFRVANVSSIRSAIEPLQAAWPFDIIQSGYGIKFVRRGGASVVTVPYTDLDARSAANAPGVSVTLSRELDTVLPQRLNINYIDAAREYDTNQQYAERLNTEAVGVENSELAIVMSADEAIQTAEILLYVRWLERYDVGPINLPPTYLNLEASDVITLETYNFTIEVRTTDINYNPDASLVISGKLNRSATYSSQATANEGDSTGPEITFDGDTIYELLDIPLVTDLQDNLGFPVAITGESPTWPGGMVEQSNDGGGTWSILMSDTATATLGYTTNALNAHDGYLVDESSELNVVLYHGDELSSVTRLGLLNGANQFAYGRDGQWEIIAAQNCTEQIDGSWLLSSFLRGRYGTEWASGLHSLGDNLILLDGIGQQFIAVSSSTLGLPRDYRGITTGQTIESDESRAFAYQGVNLECLSPVQLGGGRDASGNLTLNWVRRTRVGGQWRDNVDVPLSETSERYIVRIWDSGYATLKREIGGLTLPTVDYSSADQTTDFGSNQDPIYCTVAQISETMGEGYQARGAV